MCNEVADEQYGSRKHQQAGLLGLNKVLIGDNFRYNSRSGCYGMNDAKGSSGVDVLWSSVVCGYYSI